MIPASIILICSLAFLKRRWAWLREFPANNGDAIMAKIGLPVSHKQPWHALTVAVETVFRLPFWFIGAGTSPYHGSGIKIPRIPAILAALFILSAAIAAFPLHPVPILLIFVGPWLVYLACPVPDQLAEYRNYSSTAGFAILGAFLLDSVQSGWFMLIPMAGYTAYLAFAWSHPLEMWSYARRRTSGDQSRALQELGAHHKVMGDNWSAEACLYEAIKLNPGLAPALNNLAWIRASENKVDEAIELMKQCTERCPEYVGGWQDLGIMYDQQGNTVKAETGYRTAFDLDPSLHQSANRIGLIRFHEKHYYAAVEWFRKAERIVPNHDAYIYNVGMALKWDGKEQEASSQFAKFGSREVRITTEMVRPDYAG